MKKSVFEKRREHVGILLQRERKCKHLTQKDLAQELGVRQELISKIEASKRRIDIIELISYSEALGYSLSEIAWKIETYLHAERLLPSPKTNIKEKKYESEHKFHDAESLLNAYSPYISLAAISKFSKINPSLLSQYANGRKKAGPNQLKRITDAINKIVTTLTPVVQ